MSPIHTNHLYRFFRHVFGKLWRVLLLTVWCVGRLITVLYQIHVALEADGYNPHGEPVMDDEGNTDKSKRSLYSKLRS